MSFTATALLRNSTGASTARSASGMLATLRVGIQFVTLAWLRFPAMRARGPSCFGLASFGLAQRVLSCARSALSRSLAAGTGTLAALFLALWLLPAGVAAADGSSGPPWLRVEHASAEPSIFEGYASLRLYVTAVDLHGRIIDITGKDAFALKLGSKKERYPYIAGTFGNLGDELAVAIVINTSPDFAESLPKIKEQVSKLIEALPREAQLAVIGYDDQLHGARRLAVKTRASKGMEDIELAVSVGPKALLKAVDTATRALRRAKPSAPHVYLRRVMIVIGDGLDESYPSPEGYREAAKRAARDEIRIHTIAFAPDGNRLPLRGLAELSKHSEGTFRFVYFAGGFEENFSNLRKELEEQYVLTFFVPAEELKAKRVGLTARGMEGVGPRVGGIACGGSQCPQGAYCVGGQCVIKGSGSARSAAGWAVIAGAVAGGVILFFVVLSLVLRWVLRRREHREDAAAMAAQDAAGAGQHAAKPGQMAHAAGQTGAPAPGSGHAPPAQPASGHYPALPSSAPASGAYPRHMPASGAYPSPMAAPGAYPGQQGHGHVQGYGHVQGNVPSLLILSGPQQGRRIPLHHGFLIGTDTSCHLVLTGDGFASSRHAVITMDTRGVCTLLDQGSTNGTHVNGVRVREKPLSHGMHIKMGATEVRFLTQ